MDVEKLIKNTTADVIIGMASDITQDNIKWLTQNGHHFERWGHRMFFRIKVNKTK